MGSGPKGVSPEGVQVAESAALILAVFARLWLIPWIHLGKARTKTKLRLPRRNQRRKDTRVSPSSEWAKPHQRTARAVSEENPVWTKTSSYYSRRPQPERM